jgi:lipopolysaccharide biosynthesis glycosyltransferase
MRKLYFENAELINNTKDKYGIGADQTILNFMLRRHNIDVKLLPYKYNATCMHKKELIGEDMLHTKLTYVMHFNGLPNKKQTVPHWMKKTYEYLYG